MDQTSEATVLDATRHARMIFIDAVFILDDGDGKDLPFIETLFFFFMQVACNPSDATLVVITGPYTFRIMNVSETVWRQWGWCKAENVSYYHALNII